MEGVFAILAVFGMPVVIVWIRHHFKFREKELALREKQAADPKLLEAHAEEKKQLEARIANLETIVCSVDFELNQRLNRVLAAAPSLALPAAPSTGETAAAGGTLSAAEKLAAVSGDTLPAAVTPPTTRSPLGQLAVGQVVLGRYTIEREIGRGGMGAVYLASDAKLSERVALKTISSMFAADPDDLADRFRREVQAARRVTHPNVIRIHDLGEDGPLLFLSMEYVEGETLFARVRRVGPLPLPEAIAILSDVGAGVAAAHAAGVVHRDLKPQNVLLGGTSAKRIVKVIDFGLAKGGALNGMTATGMILGTPEYMAPEQIRRGESDPRSDVYALGATAYYALTGRPPFTGPSPIAVGFAQVHDAPPPLRAARPELPASLEALLLRSLAKDPAARFVDAVEWRKALTSV